MRYLSSIFWYVEMELYEHQILAVDRLKNGSILCGGVGSGKSRTALAYFFIKECKGSLVINGQGDFSPMQTPKDLYIITTARKRDTLEWEGELAPFGLTTDPQSLSDISITVDSWNNIGKYSEVENAFFIFDEQRVVGNGTWVKAFLKIAKKNHWILLSATPGDTWMDYIPVFIANGFYKNRTEFIRRHVVYNRFTKYPKVDHYVDCGRLIRLRKDILVNMKFIRKTKSIRTDVITDYDKTAMDKVMKDRWNIFEDRPIRDASELCSLMRKISNTDQSRIDAVKELINRHPKVIIFYNFDYELEILRTLVHELDVPIAEWNGHKHQPIPDTPNWVYLVQYAAGAEGWNCTSTNVIIFFSQNYSYKMSVQSAGRIDRLNTPYSELLYYYIRSNSPIDIAIAKTLAKKKDFNERSFAFGMENDKQPSALRS